ncbi:hypothetical protein DPMN_000083 [Dreissena polymorpha]|uniref:Uncharacterized protein n=1 Tax=Dreissena polymorpha TaxID=45954 RepID=A0A9D4MHC4_DREPO|nr:hypothetical protein DPMN_000083 [Dreissena polymorpha]
MSDGTHSGSSESSNNAASGKEGPHGLQNSHTFLVRTQSIIQAPCFSCRIESRVSIELLSHSAI